MIRIMHTSFTFIDWLLFREPSTFCRYPVCLLFSSPTPPSLYLFFLDLVTCDFYLPFTCIIFMFLKGNCACKFPADKDSLFRASSRSNSIKNNNNNRKREKKKNRTVGNGCRAKTGQPALWKRTHGGATA